MRAFADQLATAVRRSELAAAETHARTLAEIDQFRTALLRAVSHDLRTPLAAIKAAASSLEQDDVDWPDHARRDFIATIVEEGDRLDRIITNLLDASRLETGVLAFNSPPSTQPTCSNEPRTPRLPASTVTSRPPRRADRSGRPGLLERVLENLLINAARYAPGAVQLRIDHDCDAGTSRIRVIDHGPGVPDGDVRSHLFRGFHRLDDRGAGVGLGLAVSHGFIEAMGGSPRPSETPGGGLTMDIVLPSEDRGRDRW